VKPAQELFLEDKMSASHAVLLCRLPESQQSKALTELKREEMSVRDLGEWIESNVHLNLKEAVFPTHDDGKVKSSALVPGALACLECPKRTGASPQLFPDVKDADTCTDPGCFHSKEVAFVKVQLGTHPDAKPLSVGSFYGSAKPKGLTGWTESSKGKCRDTVQGVVIEIEKWHGDGSVLGKLKNVCTNARCKVHHPYQSTGRITTKKTPKQKAEEAIRAAVTQQMADLLWDRMVRVKGVPAEAARYLCDNFCNYAIDNNLNQHCYQLAFGKRVPDRLGPAIAKLQPGIALALATVVAASEDLESKYPTDAAKPLFAWAGLNRKKLTAQAVKKAAAEAKLQAKAKATAKRAKKAA
jgi:hypothetical protein